MSLRRRLPCMAGFAFAAAVIFTSITMAAQTVISNETLVTTTLVVNKKPVTAKCGILHCKAETSMFAPIPVACPSATGRTCTFHISLDAKISMVTGATSFYQFLVDGTARTIGPTGKHGSYIFEEDLPVGQGYPVRLSYPASVVSTVTNVSSNNHRITVSVGCRDISLGFCGVTAHWSTMRIDVFEP